MYIALCVCAILKITVRNKNIKIHKKHTYSYVILVKLFFSLFMIFILKVG